MGVKINSGSSGLAASVQEKPTFESTETPPEPVAKKKAKITKPEIVIPPEFEPDWGPAPHWRPMSEAPHDRIILVACRYDREPGKFFYWPVKWFEGPHGPGFYVCGTQWHSLDEECIRGWTSNVGHPE